MILKQSQKEQLTNKFIPKHNEKVYIYDIESNTVYDYQFSIFDVSDISAAKKGLLFRTWQDCNDNRQIAIDYMNKYLKSIIKVDDINNIHDAIKLSKYIVKKCEIEEFPISNLQLQYILFCIQREFLSKDKIAFFDDICAWGFGAVVPNVYYKFCHYGAMPISGNFINYNEVFINDKEIDYIIETKRLLKLWEISQDIQKQGGAWYRTFLHGAGNRDIIYNDVIKCYG